MGSGAWTVRDMAGSTQERVREDELVEKIRVKLRG
jgi:hypothetical protein